MHAKALATLSPDDFIVQPDAPNSMNFNVRVGVADYGGEDGTEPQ